MPEAKTQAFAPSASHPNAREMVASEGVSLGDLASKAMSMSRRGGSPTPPAATTEATPSGPGGINELSAAPSMGISPTARSAFASSGPAPASPGLVDVQSASEAAKDAQGPMAPREPGQTYQGTWPVGDRR